jgi:hypothetical protein
MSSVDSASVDALVAMVAFFAMTGVLVAGSLYKQHRQRAEFSRAFTGDGKFQVFGGGFFSPFGVRAVRGSPQGEIVAAGGGDNEPTTWESESSAPRTARRTTVSLSVETVFGHLREKIGLPDVQVGDADFDRQFCLRGSEADVVRGIFAQEAVRAAARQLFGAGQVNRFTVDAAGRVQMSAARDGLSPDEARALLLGVLTLVSALEAHAHARPVAPPSTTARLADGVGGATGAPVAVPLGVDDKRTR